jgi:hypothetical protein
MQVELPKNRQYLVKQLENWTIHLLLAFCYRKFRVTRAVN